jgi:hypothetical protein
MSNHPLIRKSSQQKLYSLKCGFFIVSVLSSLKRLSCFAIRSCKDSQVRITRYVLFGPKRLS